MDGQVASDWRGDGAGRLDWLLPVFPDPSGTGYPTRACLEAGRDRFHSWHSYSRHLFPHARRTLDAQGFRERTSDAGGHLPPVERVAFFWLMSGAIGFFFRKNILRQPKVAVVLYACIWIA
jgi:hypothetical protein